MRFVSALLAIFLVGSVWADGPKELPVAPAQIQQASAPGKSTDPSFSTAEQHTVIQGPSNYATCINNVTGATAIATTCFAVAITHIPAGGVAGLLVGASGGRFLLGPIVCSPDPIH